MKREEKQYLLEKKFNLNAHRVTHVDFSMVYGTSWEGRKTLN